VPVNIETTNPGEKNNIPVETQPFQNENGLLLPNARCGLKLLNVAFSDM